MLDDEGNIFAFQDEKVFYISSADRNNFIEKYIKKTRKKKSTTSPEKTQTLSISQETKKEEDISSLGFFTRLIFVFGIAFLALLF